MEANYKIFNKNKNDLYFILILLFIIVSSFFLQVKNDSGYIPLGRGIQIPETCFFKLVTGYNCPSCGLTRSFISISHLDFVNAFRYNAAGLLAYLLCVLQIILRTMKMFSISIPKQRALRLAIKVNIALVVVMILVNWCLYFSNL
ncbi:MAG: DUF2752 domain-containing protein [Clostridiaceae bacterium]|nr:DUF2752 domain-containing protein [Clostridiaceae bacterium]